MSGFNMPPGVSPSDIPGNRPGDDLWERAWEEIADEVAKGFKHTTFKVQEATDAFMATAYADRLIERRIEGLNEPPERDED